MKKVALFSLVTIAIISLCWSVYRDVQIDKLFPSDLRNRIVGARLQKDGKLPYFYKWKPADGIRYYDPQNFDTLAVSTSTASPFFHQLLYPIADMEQRTISRLWIVIQYVLLFIMTGIAFRFAVTASQKIAVVVLSISFLFTEAWINLIAPGQMYLFIPFLALLFYFFLQKKDSLVAAVFAGICAISLVLIRPNAVLMYIPFVFIAGSFSIRYKLFFFIPVLLMLGYVVSSPFQRALWKNYSEALSEQLKVHLENGEAASGKNEKDPGYVTWEGWNMQEVEAEEARTSYKNYSENGNFFVLVKNVTGKRLSPLFLAVTSFVLIIIIVSLFYLYNRKTGFSIYNIALLGFCLYMIADLFSPIYRHQYYTVQWLFPLFLAAGGYLKMYRWIYIALALGIFLNVINSPYIKMEHTIGEYLILGAMLLLAFVYNKQQQELSLNPNLN